jgi:Rrf2 family protein
MKLSRASTYALHAVVYLAKQKQPGPVASHIVAKAEGIPERFLLKVLKPLVSARILLSVKGPNGGYRLARSPADISMLDVVQAVDGPIQGVAPMSVLRKNARLDERLEILCEQTAEQVRKQLQKVRIAELAGKK